MGGYQEEKSFFQKLNIPFSLIAGNPCEWRTRSKLAVRGTVDAPLIGLFKELNQNSGPRTTEGRLITVSPSDNGGWRFS